MFPFTRKSIFIAAAVLTAAGANAQSARDQISIVGSSTVYPFATVVAEQFGRGTQFKTPTVESTGAGGGLKLFCSGVGVAPPDITNASRRIKASEVTTCAGNGIDEFVFRASGARLVQSNHARIGSYGRLCTGVSISQCGACTASRCRRATG